MGPSPVDRARPGSKHHLICDGGGIPLKVITTGGNVNDVSMALDLVDGIAPVAGRPGRPRRGPDTLLADKGYDSHRVRCALTRRRIVPVISSRGSKGIQGLGKLRYVVEQTSPCSTSSHASPSASNATSTSTTRRSPSPAPSSADTASTKDQDRVGSS